MPKTGSPQVRTIFQARKDSELGSVLLQLQKGGVRYKYSPGQTGSKTEWDAKRGRWKTGLRNSERSGDNIQLERAISAMKVVWQQSAGKLSPETFRVAVEEELDRVGSYSILQFIEDAIKDPSAAMSKLPEMHPKNKALLETFLQKVVETPKLKAFAMGRPDGCPSLIEFVPIYSKQRREQPGAKNGTVRHFTPFEKHFYAMQSEMPFDYEDITPDWLEWYTGWAYSKVEKQIKTPSGVVEYRKEPFSRNTAAKVLDRVKAVVNAAYAKGYHNNDLQGRRGFSISEVEGNAVIVLDSEIKKLYDVDLSGNARLDNVRKLTVIGYSTVQRYSDWDKVLQSSRLTTVNGMDFLTITTQKTGVSVEIPVLPLLKNLRNQPAPKLITNQRFNDWVKELFELAGLVENVKWKTWIGGVERTENVRMCDVMTAHKLRHSGATSLAIKGVEKQIIQIITGHTSDQIDRYLRFAEAKVTLSSGLKRAGLGGVE